MMIFKIETDKERLPGNTTHETYYIRVETVGCVHIMGQGQVAIDGILCNATDPGVQQFIDYFEEASKPKEYQIPENFIGSEYR
jgi:hypothetical protein